jgi:predicted AAA+ superfamily ATPase
MMITRLEENNVHENLSFFPVVGILGARQVGKTTLAKSLIGFEEILYIDLELNSDLRKLDDAETYLRLHQHKCIVIDEVQRMPSLFPLIRALVDQDRRPRRFVLLGSSSPDLMRDSSESLAGRIAYTILSPINLLEISDNVSMREHWMSGGYPSVITSDNKKMKNRWLANYIKNISDRDLTDRGISISTPRTMVLLRMLAYLNGSPINYNRIAKKMDVAHTTIARYISILEGSYLIRLLEPYFVNNGKRLVKSPKIYFTDSGLHHHLAGIRSLEALYGSELIGSCWEGYVINQVIAILPEDWSTYYYRTHAGSECDLILENERGELWCIEIKYSNAPSISKGFYTSIEDIKPVRSFVITPESETYQKKNGTTIMSLASFLKDELLNLYLAE